MGTIILLVGGDGPDQAARRDFLRAAGFEVCEAVGGDVALHLAARQNPGLIVFEGDPPDLDGEIFCRRLRSHPATAAIPVVQLTADPTPTPGVSLCLTPAVAAADFLAVVRLLLRGQPGAGGESPEGMETDVRERAAVLMRANLALLDQISERRRAEAALRGSEERFKAFMDNSPALAWIKDAHGRYVYANRLFAARVRFAEWGLPPTDFDLWPEEVAREVRRGDLQVLSSDQAREFTIALPPEPFGPADWWGYCFPFRGPDGEHFVGGVAVDVTERRRMEEALREREARLRALMQRQLSVQEEEQRRIARDLHDGIGQWLISLLVGLRTLELAPTPAVAGERTEELRRIVAAALEETRRLVRGLRPTVLDDLGLAVALEHYTADYARAHRIEVYLHAEDLAMGRLPPVVETALYRIVQEALTNTAKHAAARSVTIIAERHAAAVQLIVEDDGDGFDSEALLRGPALAGHCGLSGMRERAALLGGSCIIESKPGGGTTLCVRLPLKDHHVQDPGTDRR